MPRPESSMPRSLRTAPDSAAFAAMSPSAPASSRPSPESCPSPRAATTAAHSVPPKSSASAAMQAMLPEHAPDPSAPSLRGLATRGQSISDSGISWWSTTAHESPSFESSSADMPAPRSAKTATGPQIMPGSRRRTARTVTPAPAREAAAPSTAPAASPSQSAWASTHTCLDDLAESKTRSRSAATGSSSMSLQLGHDRLVFPVLRYAAYALVVDCEPVHLGLYELQRSYVAVIAPVGL